MKPITYLCFTLLSIIIQFCLMDFINDQTRADNTVIDFNSDAVNNMSNLRRTLRHTPHALYYRAAKNNFQVKTKLPIVYNNDSINESALTTSTELASTIFELLYDENVSEGNSDSATEMVSTTSEFDNVTEITFFDKQPSTVKPTVTPKKTTTNKCSCNLLFKACDINCCCDTDCSDQERRIFTNCDESKAHCNIGNLHYLNMCPSQYACNEGLQSGVLGYLFCIEKTNLPETSNTPMIYPLDINQRLKWHTTRKTSKNIQFIKTLYSIGQPVWLVTNNTIDYLQLPATVTNEYCNGHKALAFLRNENIKCYVKLKDLHVLDVIKISERTKIASPKESTLNSTKTDCTTLHCINWTLLTCDEHKCIEYDNELHAPSCSESYCDNIGVKVAYEFYCNASRITRANVKFHTRTVPMALEYVTQEVTVNYYFGNNSIDNVVRLSGNPGYIRGLPLIVSLSNGNHTENFYNNSAGKINYLLVAQNKNGVCVLTNLTHNVVKFGYNKRIKCRAHFGHNFTIHNGTYGCLYVQRKIDEMYGLKSNLFISPYGNPKDVSDDNWVTLQKFQKNYIYGAYHPKDSKLLCYNLIIRIAFIIAYADTNASGRENKILSARVESTKKNITFSIEDLSTVLTIDTFFVDSSKPPVHEYLDTTHLNFHLPKDLFFPLASSNGNFMKNQMSVYLSVFMLYILQIK